MKRPLSIFACAILAVPVLAAAQPDAAPYQLAIVQPADESTVFDDNGDVTVRLASTPRIEAGDQLEVLLDGVPAETSGLEVALTGVDPGLHVLRARVIDSTGNLSALSSSTVFYMRKPSILYPNRRAK
jgi:hypothetical protein